MSMVPVSAFGFSSDPVNEFMLPFVGGEVWLLVVGGGVVAGAPRVVLPGSYCLERLRWQTGGAAGRDVLRQRLPMAGWFNDIGTTCSLTKSGSDRLDQ